MPKTPHTFKLSKQAEQDIAAIRARFPYLNDTTAIEYALREKALTITTQETIIESYGDSYTLTAGRDNQGKHRIIQVKPSARSPKKK